jgi:hypothetical protein
VKIDLLPPQNLNEFFPWLKKESEKVWAALAPYDPMKWLPGLTDDQIDEYERRMGFAFPAVYRMFLRCMNGTEERYHFFHTFLRCMNGTKERYHFFHSYPRDLRGIIKMIDWACKIYGVKRRDLTKRGIPHIMPISKWNRFMIMDGSDINPVFGIIAKWPGIRIPINKSLSTYLFSSIFCTPPIQPVATEDTESIYSRVKFWLDDPVLVSRWGFSDIRNIRLANVYPDKRINEVKVDSGSIRFEFKKRIAKRLLTDGNRVRISVLFNGKKIHDPDVGMELLRRMLEELKGNATVEQQPRVLEKEWTVLLAPIPH